MPCNRMGSGIMAPVPVRNDIPNRHRSSMPHLAPNNEGTLSSIQHRPGNQNTNADALSRSPTISESPAIQEVPDDEITIGVGATRIDQRWQPFELRTVQQRDGEISQVVDQLQQSNILPELSGKWSDNGILRRYRQLWTQLEMVDGILHRKVEGARLLVAPTAIRNEGLHLAHDGPSAGHLGFS